jgi:outer membrane receptor protein involved in Fe transport
VTATAPTTTRSAINQDESYDIYSVALEYEVPITEQLSAVLGAGWAEQRRSESSDEDYTYLAGLRYSITDDTALRASVARKIRFPTLRDLYQSSGNRIANPNLSTEVTQNYEVAVDQRLGPDALLTVALFRIDAEDFIERGPNNVVQNFEEYRFQGVETSLRWTPIRDLRLLAGYTYLDSKNMQPNGGTDRLQNRPEHKVTLTADYYVGYGVALNAQYLYVNGSYALERAGGNAVPVQTLELDDYHLINVGATYDLLPGGAAQIFARGENLLDEDYEDSFGFPQAGLSGWIGLRARW